MLSLRCWDLRSSTLNSNFAFFMFKLSCSSAPVGGDSPDFENCVLPKHNLNQEIAKKNDMKAYEKKK